MDNFGLRIVAEGGPSLVKAFELAFAHNCAGRKVKHYSVRPRFAGEKQDDDRYKAQNGGWKYGKEPKQQRLIFFWHQPESGQDHQELPFELDAAGAADFAARWLEGSAEYPREPDHDGDNGKGWCAYVEGWGHVDGSHYAVIAVSPAWACYGK